jgi:hypothetical protein
MGVSANGKSVVIATVVLRYSTSSSLTNVNESASVQRVLGPKRWFTLCNVLDLLSTLLLITTAADDLIDHNQDWLSEFVRSFASSIGMGVKWLGLLGYLDSFQCERSHCVLTRPCA